MKLNDKEIWEYQREDGRMVRSLTHARWKVEEHCYRCPAPHVVRQVCSSHPQHRLLLDACRQQLLAQGLGRFRVLKT